MIRVFRVRVFQGGGRRGKKAKHMKISPWRSSFTLFLSSLPLLPKIAIRKVDCTYAFSILFELKFGSTFLPSCVRHVWQIGLWLLREVDERLIQIGIYRRWMEKWMKLIERLKVIKLIFILWRWKLI